MTQTQNLQIFGVIPFHELQKKEKIFRCQWSKKCTVHSLSPLTSSRTTTDGEKAGRCLGLSAHSSVCWNPERAELNRLAGGLQLLHQTRSRPHKSDLHFPHAPCPDNKPYWLTGLGIIQQVTYLTHAPCPDNKPYWLIGPGIIQQVTYLTHAPCPDITILVDWARHNSTSYLLNPCPLPWYNHTGWLG